MIGEVGAWAFCKEDISLIENYEEAVNDKENVWDCHHRTEIWWDCDSKDLIDNECYYHRPAKELIFLTHAEHAKLHNKLGEYSRRPDAWCKTKEGRAHASKRVSNSRWYNDGITNIRIEVGTKPPKGFKPGRTFGTRQRNKTCTNGGL